MTKKVLLLSSIFNTKTSKSHIYPTGSCLKMFKSLFVITCKKVTVCKYKLKVIA